METKRVILARFVDFDVVDFDATGCQIFPKDNLESILVKLTPHISNGRI